MSAAYDVTVALPLDVRNRRVTRCVHTNDSTNTRKRTSLETPPTHVSPTATTTLRVPSPRAQSISLRPMPRARGIELVLEIICAQRAETEKKVKKAVRHADSVVAEKQQFDSEHRIRSVSIVRFVFHDHHVFCRGAAACGTPLLQLPLPLVTLVEQRVDTRENLRKLHAEPRLLTYLLGSRTCHLRLLGRRRANLRRTRLLSRQIFLRRFLRPCNHFSTHL